MTQLEQVRERRREEETACEAAGELGPRLGQRLRLCDRDELRRRPVEPREEVTDLGHGQALEPGVRPRVLRRATKSSSST